MGSDLFTPQGSPAEWARAHPSFFFNAGYASEGELVSQLVLGVKTLGAQHIEVLTIDSWSIVAAHSDWLATPVRFPIDDSGGFDQMTPFPELGQNCTRPEFLVIAFAENVVMVGPSGTRVLHGRTDDMILDALDKHKPWRRAIAFKGLRA